MTAGSAPECACRQPKMFFYEGLSERVHGRTHGHDSWLHSPPSPHARLVIVKPYLFIFEMSSTRLTLLGWAAFEIQRTLITIALHTKIPRTLIAITLHTKIPLCSNCLILSTSLGRRFAAALLPRLFGKNRRSHHKGATDRVRTGDQRPSSMQLPTWQLIVKAQSVAAKSQGQCKAEIFLSYSPSSFGPIKLSQC